MSDKSELLNKLKIDRSEEEQPARISVIFLIVMMLLSFSVGGGTVWIWRSSGDTELQAAAERTAAQSIEKVSNSAAPAVKKSPKKIVAKSDKILNASGYITARRMATVSAEVMGLITAVNVEEGMSVKKGQILAQLDNAVATVDVNYALAQLTATKSRVARIKANLAEAKRVLKRSIELSSKNFSSEADVSSARANKESLTADLNTARAEIRVAELEVERQQERLDNHTIRAPFAGVVTVKNAQPGEIVAPSSAGGGFTRTGICTIVDMNSLEIEVDVNEAFIGRVFEGQKVEAHLDAYSDWTIPAIVIAVIPTADRAKATVRVRIGIKVKDARILPDMGVKVVFLKE
ncbi:MAG: efflux transporter periplasmic adaptor subunit [Alphaproteobacteria bacterium]|nr:MAG: efflux transporter periplasmic adaptor subunit [Alphaproteobacteria bacterium]